MGTLTTDSAVLKNNVRSHKIKMHPSGQGHCTWDSNKMFTMVCKMTQWVRALGAGPENLRSILGPTR